MRDAVRPPGVSIGRLRDEIDLRAESSRWKNGGIADDFATTGRGLFKAA